MMNGHGEGWAKVDRLATTMLDLNERRGALDVEKAIATRSCLGRALGLEDDAINLVLAGLDSEALRYFVVIKELCDKAVALGDRYIYRGATAEDFSRYSAYRAAALAAWFVARGERSRLQSEMMRALKSPQLPLTKDVQRRALRGRRCMLPKSEIGSLSLKPFQRAKALEAQCGDN